AGLLLAIVPLLLIRDQRPGDRETRRPETGDRETRRPETGDRETTDKGQRTRDNRQRTQPLTFRGLLERVPEPWRGMVLHPGPLLKLLASPALISIGAALLIPYLNLFFKQRFAVSDQSLGAIFAALGVTTGVAALAGPLLSARVGKIRAVVMSQ